MFPPPCLGLLGLRMGEADVSPNQTDEKPPEAALVSGEDSVVWSHEVEVCLFHAMIGHKPVGKRARRSPVLPGSIDRYIDRCTLLMPIMVNFTVTALKISTKTNRTVATKTLKSMCVQQTTKADVLQKRG